MTNKSTDRLDSFLGYFVEAPRALFYLVENLKHAKVKIEKFDDVSVYDYDNNVLYLEQIKYKDEFKVTNYTKDLWKTLNIWVNQVKRNPELYSNANFCIYSVMGYQLDGFANSIFNKIVDEKTFHKEWENIRKMFNSSSPELIKIFDDLNKNIDYLKFVCIRAKISQPKHSFKEDFEALVKERYKKIQVDNFNELVECLFGWFTNRIMEEDIKLTNELSFTQKDLEEVIFCFKRELRYKLKDYGELNKKDIQSLEDSQMVKQIKLITNNRSLIENVPKDYLIWELLYKFCTKKGIMNESQKRAYLQDLHDKWVLEKDLLDTTKEEKKQGLELYNKCTNANLNFNIIKLSGPERVVLKGILNELANLDFNHELSIGWHPRYEELLGAKN